jgi:hypothetical protein
VWCILCVGGLDRGYAGGSLVDGVGAVCVGGDYRGGGWRRCRLCVGLCTVLFL